MTDCIDQRSFPFVEPMPDPVEVHYEARQHAARAILEEYDRHCDDPNYRQEWELVSKARLRRIWSDYVRQGFTRDERGVDAIADVVLLNISKIEANTVLCGHTGEDSLAFAEEVLERDLPADYLERDSSFFEDERGSWRISDYAVRPLAELAIGLRAATRSEDRLQWIDRILNVVHQRSDLAAWFVEGGRRTLCQLSA